MGRSQDFALDSQCFTYLITALVSPNEPTDVLAKEKVALVRSFLYSGAYHFITPTADKEWRQISDQSRRDFHKIWNSVNIGTTPFYSPNQQAEADARVAELLKFHNGRNDCLILAEAEILGASKLLSFDKLFVRNLTLQAKIELISPSEHWLSMNIAPGSKPEVVPHTNNPLAQAYWWRI